MKRFELTYLVLEPFFPPLWRRVRAELLRLSGRGERRPRILDVGGRKSHYSIGVPARITISDLIRRSKVQQTLHLGISGDIARQTLDRRSNVKAVVFDDMTSSGFRNGSFDCVVAVEVIEHVEQDEAFVREIGRVLRPGGTLVMTTPNGDYVRNTNPDHKRHYSRTELELLLGRYFADVDVHYAVAGGRFRRWALKSWSPRRPVQTMRSMLGSLVNGWQSARRELRNQPLGTHHLFAIARKGA
jgi:SAM-dependent methyltransferase